MVRAVHTPGLAGIHEADGDAADELLRSLKGGEFEFQERSNGQRMFWYVCPGCRVPAPLYLRPVVVGHPPSWEWDGNAEAPTLQPSINHVGCWHGWLRSGEFVSC